MRDYTEIFTEAAGKAAIYSPQRVQAAFNAVPNLNCYVDSDCARDDWFTVHDACLLYGYLHCRYPLMLLKGACPAFLLELLRQNQILYTALEEPMRCEETVLRLFVSSSRIIDERFLDSCDYTFDDERFLRVLERLETGRQSYINASGFQFSEIHYL